MSEILTAEEVIKEVARCHGEEVFISSGYAAHDDLVMWMRRLVEDATKALTAERDALREERDAIIQAVRVGQPEGSPPITVEAAPVYIRGIWYELAEARAEIARLRGNKDFSGFFESVPPTETKEPR